MKTFLVPAHDTPLVSFQITNRIGTTIDPLGKEGLICHTAELAARGAGERNREEIDDALDALGASVGISAGRDYLSLRGSCLMRNVPTVFDIAMDILAKPRFSATEHEKLVRETTFDLDEIRDDDGSLAQRFFTKHCHPNYGYCRTALGTNASLQRITLNDVRSSFDRLFAPNTSVFGVVGPYAETDVASLADEVDRILTTFLRPVGEEATTMEIPPCPPGRRLIFVDKPGRQQCQILIGHIVPRYGSEVFDALRVAETAFGGMFSSRLMREIRVKHGWSYGAFCSIHRARGPHWLQIGLAPAAEVCAPALKRTLELYGELIENGITESELNFTRNYLVGSAAFSQATPRQRLRRKIEEEVLDLPSGYENHFPERIQALDANKVNHAIRAHLTSADLCVVVVGTAETTLAELDNLGFDSIEVHPYQSY